MKKETMVIGTFCDCCEKELNLDIEGYVAANKIDLCYSCSGQIFSREVISKVPEDKFKAWVKSLKNDISGVEASFDPIPQGSILDSLPVEVDTLGAILTSGSLDDPKNLKDL